MTAYLAHIIDSIRQIAGFSMISLIILGGVIFSSIPEPSSDEHKEKITERAKTYATYLCVALVFCTATLVFLPDSQTIAKMEAEQ